MNKNCSKNVHFNGMKEKKNETNHLVTKSFTKALFRAHRLSSLGSMLVPGKKNYRRARVDSFSLPLEREKSRIMDSQKLSSVRQCTEKIYFAIR